MNTITIWLILFCIALMSSCIKVKVVTVGQKTAFERQLIGTFEELDDQLALVASVRQGGSSKVIDPSTGVDMQSRALAARRRQLFNDDDISELKGWGCIGESNQGMLETRSCDKAAQDDKIKARARRMAIQENQDREVIIELVLMLDSALTPADRPQLEKVYASLMRSKALKGYWVQGADGSWKQVE